jgi:hypothetical protein
MSDALSRAEVSRLVQLVARACDEATDVRGRMTLIIKQLATELDATLAAGAICDGLLPGQTVVVNALVFGGTLDQPAREAFLAAANDPEAPDLAHRETIARFKAGVNVFPRHEVLDDATWQGCLHYQRYRAGNGVEEPLYAGVSCAVPGRFLLISAHRPLSAGRYTERETAFVAALLASLGWLFEQHERELTAGAVITTLPGRLRNTLHYVLRGLSEKQIASRLDLSQHTVHEYMKGLLKHFGVSSRAGLMARVAELRLKTPLTPHPELSRAKFDLTMPDVSAKAAPAKPPRPGSRQRKPR